MFRLKWTSVFVILSAFIFVSCCDCKKIDINEPDADIADEDLMQDVNEEDPDQDMGEDSQDMDEDTADADGELSNIIFVKSNASGADDGTSWENAFTGLQDALSAAIPGDEIWVAKGTYYPTTDDDREISFKMVESVSMYGGFAGNEIKKEERDFEKNETILSGDIGIKNDISDNSYHVVTGADDTELDGFTIADGNADEGIPHGGGIYSYSLKMSISNCIFKNNSAEFGGGVFNEKSILTINDCSFFGNTASNQGGGIGSKYGETLIADSSFEKNKAELGGGISLIYSGLEVRSSSFTENSVISEYSNLGNGGALNSYSSDVTVQGSIFKNNSSAYMGGALANARSTLRIEGSMFDGNTAESTGGGIYNSESSGLRVFNTFFNNNSAQKGAGVMNISSGSFFANVVFFNNSAEHFGGGICVYDSSIRIVNGSILNNNADLSGGGIYITGVETGSTISAEILNTIVWGNSAEEEEDNLYISDDFQHVVRYSDIQNGFEGDGNIDSDPLFVDPENGAFHLKSNSPCIDAGSKKDFYVWWNDASETDIDGNPRVNGDEIDMGAYEFQ